MELAEALSALNTARATPGAEVIDIYIFGDNEGVGVEWVGVSPSAVEKAAEAVSGAMGEGSPLYLCEDFQGRWVLVPRA